MTNERCEHLIQRDEIWYGSERHDFYCLERREWCPDCDKCGYNKTNADDDADGI